MILFWFYCCTVHFEDSLSITHQRMHKLYKVKVIPQQAEVAQRVPGRLRPRIFLTFDTTRW